jgi:hypothetical protein
VLSVNIAYSDEAAKKLKALKGYVSHWVNKDGDNEDDQSMQIEWEVTPPNHTKSHRQIKRGYARMNTCQRPQLKAGLKPLQ